ncbi:MAG: RnfABCDGE type electron transport complex subunit G [Clostridiaceae bacterium]
MMKNIKLAFKLFIIAGMTGLILGAVHAITANPIAAQQKKTKDLALVEVLPAAKTFNKSDVKLSGSVLEVNEGKDGDIIKGYAVTVSSKGYAGDIQIMVGISAEGKIEGIKILSMSETPGLGAKASEPEFSGQYKGKSLDNPLEVIKIEPSNPNEIEAITGSTITSRAVTKGVNEAVEFYKSELEGGQK